MHCVAELFPNLGQRFTQPGVASGTRRQSGWEASTIASLTPVDAAPSVAPTLEDL